jgi:hypothetical protein
VSPSAERLRRLLAFAPIVLVTVYGLGLLWPVPTGRMPLSADHTVHLTRIWMFAGELAEGRVRGWSPVWFFGTPVGELYPVLGDLLIVAVRALSLGLLSWSQAYALGFSIVFVAQGWVMLRVGRAMGLGPLPGLVAACLVLSDAGAYREGGWEYTVLYGVWPQTLATSLTWLALGELACAAQTEVAPGRRRRIAIAAAAMAAALLAHPMSMLSMALGGPLLVAMLGTWSRERLERAATVGLLAAALGLALAAWWIVPMLDHRAWMASYGWLWLPLDRMLAAAKDGHLTQHVPAAVTGACALGLVAVALMGTRFARFVGVYAIFAWVLASQDAVWTLRLDRISEGFTHIQYQRFVTLAKPGFFLMAGAAIGIAVRAGNAVWRRGSRRTRPLALVAWTLAAALGGSMAQGQARVMKDRHVGEIQLERAPNMPQLHDDHAALTRWLDARWSERTRFHRATVHEGRNVHWFMDLPVYSAMPLYKQGFTPGDNFVHKPETGTPALLDRLQVRYVTALRRKVWRGADLVADFGAVTVFERRGWDAHAVAWLDGPGDLEILVDAPEQDRVRVRVHGSGGTTRLVFGIAGYPRWALDGPNGPVEWFEAPVIGRGAIATVQERRSGALRGGKAHGNDGTEPTLIAADVGDGEYVLRYRTRRARDVLAGLLSLLALGLVVLLARPEHRRGGARATRGLVALERRLHIVGHPLVLAACVLTLTIVVAVRQIRAQRLESQQAVGWLIEGRARASGMRPAFFKTDMLIRPAVRVAPRRRGPAVFELHDVALGETLDGWIAIDDDAAKLRSRGTHRVLVEARPVGDEAWHALTELTVAHQPGSRRLEIPTGELRGIRADLRVVVTSTGDAPPPLGFDLDLGGEA